MRLLFLGSTELGFACLDALLDQNSVTVCGILTTPKKFEISYAPLGVSNVLHKDFSKLAIKAKCKLIYLDGPMTSDNLMSEVRSLRPDCIFAVGWYHKVPVSWLEQWPTFGIHASLLPKYAGGAPLVWALINGERKTGVTLFQFGAGVDDGPIVAQSPFRIRPKDEIGTVLQRAQEHAVKLTLNHVPGVIDKGSPRRNQILHQRTLYPQRSPNDGEINLRMPLRKIRNFVRAQTHPYPGAFLRIGNKQVKVWEMGRTRLSIPTAPRVFCEGGRYFLKTRFRIVELTSVSVSSDAGH